MASRKREETEMALRLCHHRCVICGWQSRSIRGESLVVGAHIKPVAELERDSYEDIIALCPNHHAEFDAFLFYIDPKLMKVVHVEKESPYDGQTVDIPHIRKEFLGYRQYLWNQAQETRAVVL